MKRGFYQLLAVVSILLGGLFAAFAIRPVAAEEIDRSINPYRILCISSYNYSFSTVPDQLDGLLKGLEGVPAEVTYEFMDAKNYYRAEDISEFYAYIKYKLDNADPFDLVVLADDTALHFGMNNAETLFPDTPIVFMGVNNLTDAETAAARSGVTGVAEIVDFEGNARLFGKLFPDNDHVVLILDNSNTAQGEFVEFEKFAEETGQDYDIINAAYYSQEGLAEAYSEIDEHATVVFLDIIEDGEHNRYNISSATKLLYDNAPHVPITRVSLANVGGGVLGGVSYSYYDAGINAGKMAAQILLGTDPDDIPIVEDAVTVTYFEQEAMDSFGITERDLPEEAIIVNQHQTFALFYRENTAMMNLIFLVIFLMAVIIFVLVRSNRKRQQLIYQDFMTKIPNRTYITKHLQETVESGEPFGIIMMDVDHFKSINDTLGHLVGDELLIEVARRLKMMPADEVVFARIGGDEFMGFLYHPNLKKTRKILEEVVRVMHEDFVLSCGAIHITVSLGAALYPEHTDNPGKVQGLADLALYVVKEHGRDGFEIYDSLVEAEAGAVEEKEAQEAAAMTGTTA